MPRCFMVDPQMCLQGESPVSRVLHGESTPSADCSTAVCSSSVVQKCIDSQAECLCTACRQHITQSDLFSSSEGMLHSRFLLLLFHM